MSHLLLELGCEELPASFVRRSFRQLHDEVVSRLEAENLACVSSGCMGTPRRLIVWADGIPARQPDSTKTQRGPGLKAAYDAEGNPTKALEGFCRSQGVEVADLTQEGDYVWVNKHVPGRPAQEVLGEILEASIRALTFDKSMRWGESRMRFARPIRWILAAYDGAVVDFSVETVQAGLMSRGHRFYSPGQFEATTKDSLIDQLRAAKVEPDPEERAARIVEGAHGVADGKPDIQDSLLDENVFLTEWPTAILGSFSDQFMDLPEAVLVTAMAKHEKFFPVRDASGKLTPHFVSIRNAGQDDDVRGGNEWVLNARFNDAKFFFDEDRKRSLDDFLAQTSRMTFQEKLGSVRNRADRIAKLAGALSASIEGVDRAKAEKAGLYAKADLSTGLVNELPALQGKVGAEYAAREGFDPSICEALGYQYDLGLCVPADSESKQLGLCLLLADQIDKLAGYLGIGQIPSGSSDPFALRRAVTLLIESSQEIGLETGFWPLIEKAQQLYAEQNVNLDQAQIRKGLVDLASGRYPVLWKNYRYDVLEAAMTTDAETMLDPLAIKFRVEAMAKLATDSNLLQTISRPINIVNAAVGKGIDVGADDFSLVPEGCLDSAEGATLLREARKLGTVRSAEEWFNGAKILADPINKFFDATMIMVEDASVRTARLSLLNALRAWFEIAGNVSKIVVEGS
ncbi:MAG: glycine--tRNA ligase subunit beta [Armatimonadetes bacterium]|nr:glycine--tRNA ligase subunit beta [Armatimonadota bacterium]